MKAHRLFRAGAAMALLGAFASAQEQQEGFFAGLKIRSAAQAASREDQLMPVYFGFGIECGHRFGFGNLSLEAGFMYKAGRHYLVDLTTMENVSNDPYDPIDLDWAVDSRKNQLEGITLRLAYEKPFERFSIKGGVQLGSLKFRQEYLADVSSLDGWFGDQYNGVTDKGNLSFSPFLGVSIPFLSNHFVELNVVGLNYKSINYVHVAGTVLDWGSQNAHTSQDRIEESSRLIPHIELTLGFRF
jgi:hypothetical protein